MVGTITPVLQVGKLKLWEINVSKATHSGASKIPTRAYPSPCALPPLPIVSVTRHVFLRPTFSSHEHDNMHPFCPACKAAWSSLCLPLQRHPPLSLLIPCCASDMNPKFILTSGTSQILFLLSPDRPFLTSLSNLISLYSVSVQCYFLPGSLSQALSCVVFLYSTCHFIACIYYCLFWFLSVSLPPRMQTPRGCGFCLFRSWHVAGCLQQGQAHAGLCVY